MEGRRKTFFPFHKGLLNHLVCILFFLVISTSAESFRARLNLNYSDVQHLGISCHSVDSCLYKRTIGSRDLDSPRGRNCACDYMCEEYSDCCIDAPSFGSFEDTKMKKDWKCYELRQFGGVYMKDKCLDRFSNSELVDLCENVDQTDFSDPLVTMPVTDSSNGLTYRNLYCAMCNGKSDTLVLWTPRLECPSLTIYNSSRKNLTHEYVFQNLIFDGENWGLYLDGDNGSLFFHDCVIDPVMPRLLESKIRLCKMESVSECAKDWEDEEVKAKCAAYAGLRYYHSVSYRNIHCAVCNRVNISMLTCDPVVFREMFIFRTFEHRAFSLLLDINEQKGQDVGMVQRCEEGELFDPFFKKCRSLGCLPGTIRKGGNCVPEDETSTPAVHSAPDLGSLDVVDTFDILEANKTDTNASDIVDEESRINSSIFHDQMKPPYIDNDTGISYNTSMLDNYSQLDKKIGKFKNCLLISLMAEDYVMFENKTIYVPEYDKLYEPTNYFAADGSVLICSHFDSAQEIKFTNIMGYVTVVGLGVSMLCLFLHFVVFCVVPDLRNLSGKNLMSQCIALFCAYCCYIAGQNDLGVQVCTVVAFLTIYFFQASFFWMSSMAFDVWRTLKMATTELRVSSGKQWKRFLAYSAYSWLFPLLIVGLAAVAEYSDIFPEEYRPRFAQPQCWFKHRRALLCFFAAPLFAVILSNVILFASSAKMIIITTKTTIKQQNPSQKRNFKLYLRLFILMGLTWAVGLVAGYVDIEILWYFFIILNTLQGLFIFISFSCSSKVLNYFRDQFNKFTETAEYRSSASHSTSHSGCNTNSTTALTSVSIKPTSRLWLIKKHSASPTNSSASNASRH